jgi:hypothetical protein
MACWIRRHQWWSGTNDKMVFTDSDDFFGSVPLVYVRQHEFFVDALGAHELRCPISVKYSSTTLPSIENV